LFENRVAGRLKTTQGVNRIWGNGIGPWEKEQVAPINVIMPPMQKKKEGEASKR